jgi:hypothetical protein
LNKYYKFLGLHLDKVKQYLDENNINYEINIISGKKDKDKLTVPKVIKMSENNGLVKLVVTYFSDSLI